jgi:hypothetical protein
MAQRSAARKPVKLTDHLVEARREFADDEPNALGYYPDSIVFGLQIFVGAKSTVWRFRQQRRFKGTRTSSFKTLGYWPAMDVDEARKQALIFAGSVAGGTAAPGKRNSTTFEMAFTAYLEHLKRQAEKRGKPTASPAVKEHDRYPDQATKIGSHGPSTSKRMALHADFICKITNFFFVFPLVALG